MKNNEIADIFNRIATYGEIKDDNVFKIRAYRKAAEALLNLSEDIANLRQENRLSEIPGIGEALSFKINEYLDTGKITAYENLKKEIPETILDLVEIPSVGPKKAKLFYQKLKIKSINELEKAARGNRLLGLPGIQTKTVENILKGIKLLKTGQERMDLATATTVAEEFINQLQTLKEVKRISTAGSLRRQKETVRDIDILVVSSSPSVVMKKFVSLPQVARVNAEGKTKSSVLTKDNVQVDLRVVDSKSFGAALLYFTGSKNFNVKIRQMAIKKNMKINEYGLFSVTHNKDQFLAGKTEEEMLKSLGLPYIQPELREDIGEEELFSLTKTPDLIELKDIKGDLHVHSTWSDGRSTISEFVSAAIKRGYSYIAVSDHSQRLRVARGVSAADLRKKKREIEKINEKVKNFRVFFGTEVEIDTKGELDYNAKILSEFDIVIAAIHSGFEQSSEQLTRRIVKACQNKYVRVIAHPTGKHLGKREPYRVDFQEICQAARDNNTFLEINAFPVRLDLNSQDAYFVRKNGVRFAIDTDAHETGQLDFMRLGVSVARRGWLKKEDVLNTLPLNQIIKILSTGR